MQHELDRYDYLFEIGKHLGVRIEKTQELRNHLPKIPGLNVRDLRSLDNLKIILDYLEKSLDEDESAM
ncbi:MAG: hypothetical protein ACKPKT_04215 [Dolichospermum sp.]